MRRILSLLLIVAAIAAALVWAGSLDLGPVLITREGEQKMVLRLGSVAAVRTEPGLWWRIPVLDQVLTFDRRLQYFNAQPILIQTADAQPINVDYYVLWRIEDPRVFHESFPGGTSLAVDQIQRVVGADVQELIGQNSLDDVIHGKRSEIMEQMTVQANEALGKYGLHAADVRINRTELPQETNPGLCADADRARAAGPQGARRGRRGRPPDPRRGGPGRARAGRGGRARCRSAAR